MLWKRTARKESFSKVKEAGKRASGRAGGMVQKVGLREGRMEGAWKSRRRKKTSDGDKQVMDEMSKRETLRNWRRKDNEADFETRL